MKQLKVALSSDDVARVRAVTDYATRTGLRPAITRLGVQEMYHDAPMTYPFTAMTVWQSAGAVTLPYGAPPDGPPSLRIWSLPTSLVNLPDADRRAVLPRMAVQVGTYNEATGQMAVQGSGYYGWGTLIGVGIKRIPPVAGSPATACTYELLGANEYDIVLLERLLDEMAARHTDTFVADLTLLYLPSPTGSVREGLQSDGNNQVNMFLTQVNLTTDTRPPTSVLQRGLQAGEYRTEGCWNTPYQFTKLLWEGSITRSGGYYLYYFNTKTRAGFPDRIFNDKGEATLTLLVTYARPAAADHWNRVSGYMNCVVTGDYIDAARSVVFAQADPIPIAYRPQPADTLARIAEQYYMNPTQLAEDNADQPLAQGKQLLIRNGIYAVRPDGVAPGGKLEEIAAWFATSPDAIKAANPQITDWSRPLPVYTAVRLPSLAVTVGAGPGGNSFSALAAYYGARTGEIAADNQNVPDLFPAGASLTVNGGPTQRTATVPPGVAGLEANRTVPPPVPDRPAPDNRFGELYLQHIYNLLGYRVWQNAGFSASNMGLPMGPADRTGAAAASAEKIRVPRVMQAGETWAYQQAVPFWKFAAHQAFLAVADLPDPAQSPYAGIGDVLQIDFGWQDIFGNTIITPLSDPSLDPTGILNKPPVLIGYTDALVGLGQWPSVSSQYRVLTDAGQRPVFRIELSFDPTRYNPSPDAAADEIPAWQKNARNDLMIYTRLFYQINSGDAVTFSIATNLLTNSPITLSDDQVAALKSWVNEICTYLAARARGQTAIPPGPHAVDEPIAAERLNPAQIFELSVSFSMARPLLQVDADFKDTPEVWLATTRIAPMQVSDGGAGGGTLSLKQFALDFEAALRQTGVYQLKVATGVNRERVAQSRVESSVWVVRIGLAASQAISYQILNPGAPRLFAPRPVANTLTSRTGIDIYDYTTGQGIHFGKPSRQLNFAGIDLDVWTRQFLTAVDQVLAPEFTSAAGILGHRLGQDYVQQLLDQKKSLAASLKRLVIPVLEGVDAAGQDAAQDAFEQALLVQLINFYTTDAVIQFQASVNASIKEPNADEPPRLYGLLIRTADGTAPAGEDISLTSPKLTLEMRDAQNPALLTFMLNAKDSKSKDQQDRMQRFITLSLAYQPTNVEHEIGALPGIEGYKASSWLAFVIPPDLDPDGKDTPLRASLGTFDVPLVLRAFPTPPSMISQTGQASGRQTGSIRGNLEQASLWDYAFTYSEDFHYLQDRTYVTVQFNIQDKGDLRLQAVGRDLFADLAQFITVHPAVQKDLAGILSGIDGTTADETTFQNAAAALESFIAMVRHVAEALATPTLRAPRPVRAADPPYQFFIEESAVTLEDGRQALEVALHGAPPSGIGTPEIRIEGYTGTQTVFPGGVKYTFRDLDPGKGQAIPQRTVVLPTLNVLAKQDAWASAFIKRNEQLVAVRTAGPFVYQTPEVAFTNPLHPTLDVAEVIDIARIDAPDPVTRPLPEHLSTLFQTLFRLDPRETQQIQVECRYHYTVHPDLDPVSLPVLLLPPKEVNVRTDFKVPGGGCPAGSTGPFVCTLANAIADWFSHHLPGPDSGTLWLDLTIMSDLTQRPKPLLRLRSLKLEIQYVKPPLATR